MTEKFPILERLLYLGIIIFLLIRGCERPIHTERVEIRDTTIYVTKVDSFPVHVPEPYKLIDTVIEYRTLNDSLKYVIIADYYRKRLYSDTLTTDSVQIVINDTVTENKLKGRKTIYRITFPVQITQVKPITPKRHYHLGGDVGLNQVTIKAAYQDRRGVIYSGGYDIMNRCPEIGILYRIR